MSDDIIQNTFLRVPLIEERYGRAFLVSIGIHGMALILILFGGYLFPSTAIQIGSGPGGGIGGDVSTIGVVDDFSGGAGMTKPSLVPKPPALAEETTADQGKAIPLPGSVEPKKKKPSAKETVKAAKVSPKSNIIPTAPEPGSGGIAGRSGGSGGGIGGGNGVSIGSGSGGFGDSWYARTVEGRISSNWDRPPEGVHVEMVFSFYIAADGTIYGLKKEKTSGNLQMDWMAQRAILASNPLTPPPQEFRGRPIQFIAQFIYPPNP
jgi:hypothetical protein